MSSQVADTSPDFAVIVTLPAFNAVTTPLATVATVSSELVHTTVLSVASSGDTVAVSVSVSPSVSSAVVLSRAIPVAGITFALTVTSQAADTSPDFAVIVTFPAFNAVTTPLATVAIVSSDDVHATVLSVASSGVTVAVSVSVSPSVSSAVVLSRAMPVAGITFALTVISQVADISPAFAVIVALPALSAVTTPSTTVATVSSDDVHATVLSVASSGVTVAVSVSVSPSVSSAVVLSRAIPVAGITFALTVISQVAETSPDFALIVALPALNAVTTPLATVATVSSDDVQTTVLSVAFSGVTVAVSVSVSPSVISAVVLSRVMPVVGITFALTVISQVADTSPAFAVIVALPALSAVTTPLATVATVSSDDVHVTVLSVASSGVTVAVKVSVSPSVSSAVVLSRAIPVAGITFALTVISQVALTEEFDVDVTVIVTFPALSAVTTPSLTVAIVSSDDVHVTVLSVASSGVTVAVSVSVSPSVSSAVVLSRVMPATSVLPPLIFV